MGFEQGFDIGYRGPLNRKDDSDNIPFTVGDEFDMWEKIMKEVQLGRFVGPYTKDQLPGHFYVQSPIGLVPKSGGKTQLIFHLSYNFKGGSHNKSINYYTPDEFCSVKYKDLDHAIAYCIFLLNKSGVSTLFYSKSDLMSAFRLLPVKISQRFLLTMKARHPISRIMYYFMDKCLPFGSSISCALFQLFSDVLAALLEHHLNIRVTNYLDDFQQSNRMVRSFIQICNKIGCPIAHQKTEFASNLIVFLGILLNG